MNGLEWIHEHYARHRRARVLSRQVAAALPGGASVLDVGCGDGTIARQILMVRPDVQISGVDVMVRDAAAIPVTRFDGRTLPYGSGRFDVVLFIDVLHHTDEPTALLVEAMRVARRTIVIKDHLCESRFAHATLRFMDRLGNQRHGVPLPYNYWRREQWFDAFRRLGLEVDLWRERLCLYPWPASTLFDRSLHFVARLERSM